MSLTIEEVKKNVAYKRLPIVILDERWHRLFPEKEKTSEIRKLEKNLNELLKRQGQITNDLKALKKIKASLMKEILENSEVEGESDSKRQKLMARNQKLLIEAKEKIEALEEEEFEIPEKIRTANIELMIEGVDECYRRIHQNYKDIQLLGVLINEMRTELKKHVVDKQDKEIMNTEIYSYMHDILGPEMMEIFDNSTGPGKKKK